MNNHIKIFNGVRDITERDMAVIRYYQLLSEQAEWSARRDAKKRDKQRGIPAVTITLFVFEVAVFTVTNIFINIFKRRK